jgi:anti-anti-sigma regulatory factor
MERVLKLAARLDAAAAPKLAAELEAQRGAVLRLDAAGVEVVSALALEVIIAAGLQWQADDVPFSLSAPSDRLRSVCRTLGLEVDQPWRHPPLAAGDAA